MTPCPIAVTDHAVERYAERALALDPTELSKADVAEIREIIRAAVPERCALAVLGLGMGGNIRLPNGLSLALHPSSMGGLVVKTVLPSWPALKGQPEQEPEPLRGRRAA